MSRMNYDDACDAGYDGPSPFEERRLAARRRANDMLDPRDPDYVDHDDDEQEANAANPAAMLALIGQHDRLAALNAYLLEVLKHIIAADKTRYEYIGKHAENAAGNMPKAGCRWATPCEMAQQAIAKAGEA